MDRKRIILSNANEGVECLYPSYQNWWEGKILWPLRKMPWKSYKVKHAAKSLQSCPTLWNPRDGLLPGWGRGWVLIFQGHIFLPFHTVHGVLEARILEWFAIPSSLGLHFVRTLHHDLSILDGPTWHGSLFHWVRQGYGPCDQCD